MRNLTADELYAEAQKVCNWLIEAKGYNEAYVHWVTIHESSLNFELSFKDDFQAEVESSLRYYSGIHKTIQIEGDRTLWSWAADLPNRSQRETAFLLRQLRSIEGAASAIKDLEIQEIVQGILGANTSLQNLIEHRSSSHAQ